MRRKRLDATVSWLFALGLAVASMLPIVWTVLTSFKTYIQSQTIPPPWPDPTNFGNYHDQFSGSSSGLDPLLRSLTVATLTMLITMALAIPAAYALARYAIARKREIQYWIISSRMLPLVTVIIPLSTLLQKAHLYDTLASLVIVYTASNLAFAVWLLSIFFQNVPEQIEQAGRIDGLTRWGVLWHITLPLARSSILIVALFTWIFPWNELLFGLVLTSGNAQTLPVFLSKFATETMVSWQGMAAVATVQVIPAIALTFLAQRYIVSGLSMGALAAE